MSTSEHTPPPSPAGQPTDGFFDSVRRTGLVRTDDRWVGGVSAGLARRLNVDPLIVRGLFLVSVLLGGLGLALYAVAWLLLPEASDGRIHLQEAFRGHTDIALLGAAVLLVSGLTMTQGLTPGWYLGDSDWWRGLVWLGVLVTVIALLVSRRGRSSPQGRAPGPGPTTSLRPGQPATWSTATSSPQPEGPDMPTTPMAPVPPGQVPAAGSGPAQGGPPVPPPSWSGGTQQGWSGRATWRQPNPGRTASPMGPVTALPVQAPRPPRGAGRTTFGVVVALTLLVLAGLLYADRLGRLAAPVGLVALAAAVILLGAGILVAGLRGRTAGGLGVLAVVLALVAAPVAADHRYDWTSVSGSQVAFGDLAGEPRTATEAEEGFSLGVGDARIDLTRLAQDSGEVRVPINAAIGDLTVIVPPGSTVSADVRIGGGDVTWFGERIAAGIGSTDGEDSATTIERTRDGDGDGPDLQLDIALGLGSVTVLESGR